MAYGIPGIAFADNPSIDAFGRLRVGQPSLLLDSKQVGGTPDYLATTAVTGSGATTYNLNRASTSLTVGAAAGTAIRQTKSRAIYQAGKSLLVFQTFVRAPGQANLRQRVGYFDDKNGLFSQLSGTTLSLVKRSYVGGSASDTVVPQASWNLDTMGAGALNPSGITLDISKAQILIMDLEWLGVGRVRIGFVVNGLIYYVHQFLHANVISSVYCSNPNLPLRWEIEALAGITGTASLESICGSVNSEGGYEVTGLTAGADRGNTVRTLATTVVGELVAVRMQSAFTEYATAFMQMLSMLASSSTNFRWMLVLNPTETGAGAWTAVTSSIMEKNTTRTVTAATGILIASGYMASAANAVNLDAKPFLTLGTTLAGVTDVISLQVQNLGGGNEDFLGGLNWREVY
jgi:hypothetical protein